MRRLLLYLFFIACLKAQGQTAWKPLLSPYIKTGAYSWYQTDVFSTTSNQAALARITSFSIGAFGERKFMLEELNTFSGCFALPTGSGVFGLQLHQFGNSAFAQRQAGLAYGRRLSEKVDVGVQFNYYTIYVGGYGNAAALNFEAGAIFHFTEQLQGGIHVSNPTTSHLGKISPEPIPSVYTIGLGYDASENFFLSTEIEKTEDKNLDVNASMQYKFTDRLFARAGVSSGSSVVFFGIGFKVENIRIDATASLHPQLGFTPGLMIIYNKPVKSEAQ